jgi:glycosyltransferase involved in cell wall biosynthesis
MMPSKKLVIISHTEHRKSQTGSIFGWGPTVEEINYLSTYFEEVIHVGCFEESQEIPKSYRPYTNANVAFLPIPMFGGTTILKKLNIIFKMPRIVRQIERALPHATHVQLRVPMGIGIFLIPYFSIRPRKFTFWIKYANNWGDPKPKIGFRFQRFMLKQNWANCKVTINGKWAKQASHCLSFENPCLYEKEFLNLEKLKKIKEYFEPYKLLFVGRIEIEKGVDIILDWLSKIELTNIEKMVFVGEGKDLNYCINRTLDLGLAHKIDFVGPKSREELHMLYKENHFFLFPTMASEGFPKVIAEAMAFGCVPITSEVSSLKEFLESSNAGISWNKFKTKKIESLNVSDTILNNGLKCARKYTFENYFLRLQKEVFS